MSTTEPSLAPDAAMALGIASTAIPFARTPEDEVERWIRVLRMHGQVGVALQGLGVSEAPMTEHAHNGGAAQSSDRAHDSAASTDGEGAQPSQPQDTVARVTEFAVDIAAARRASAVATPDVLVAVMRVYGSEFDRALKAHGTDSGEVLDRLGLAEAEA
jgi:hypothetical protein